MAVTKIWTIKDSLQRVLDYAANPDKTEYDALAQTLHYAENDAKTKLNESADRKSTRLNSSHNNQSRMPSSA